MPRSGAVRATQRVQSPRNATVSRKHENMATLWESELAKLLHDLTTVQAELLTFLADKRQSLVAMDRVRLDQLQGVERQLITRLQSCQRRRQELLADAARESRPSASLRSLARSLPAAERAGLESQMAVAAERARLLQHQSLANWVFVQRTLLYLTRLLEIIATGGRSEPTYGRGEMNGPGGALVDQAA